MQFTEYIDVCRMMIIVIEPRFKSKRLLQISSEQTEYWIRNFEGYKSHLTYAKRSIFDLTPCVFKRVEVSFRVKN